MLYPEYLINRIVEKVFKTEERATYLNSGSFADVYKFRKYAIKITNDEDDYIVSSTMIGKKFVHIVNTYKTYVIKDGDQTYYVIINELLTPLKSTDYKWEFRFLESVDSSLCGLDSFRTISRSKLHYLLSEDLFRNYTQERKDYIKKEVIPQLIAMYLEMRVIGMRRADFHCGNVGVKDNGVLVFLDLGYHSTEKSLDDVKERLIVIS